MISVRFNTAQFDKKMKMAMDYSYGFFDGVKMEKINFMKALGEIIKQALYKYIDARARANPDALHHVYEPNQVGNEGGRLYEFDAIPMQNHIVFSGSFLPSSGVSDSSQTPFVDKANIMENGISITVSPNNSNVLVFENEGDLVFTRNSITIEHPGGDAVAGAFGEVVDQFFNQYLTNAMLEPIFRDLRTADEFTRGFGHGGRQQGVVAGRKYLDITGVGIE